MLNNIEIPTRLRTMLLKQYMCALLLVLHLLIEKCYGQGRMLEPPGRSSMWRLGYDTPVNHNDNAVNCGGLKRQWTRNNGQCGVCGDPWDTRSPRDHEEGGVYFSKIISGVYSTGSVIDVTIEAVNVNGGHCEFRVCEASNVTQPVTRDCLDKGLLRVSRTGDTSAAGDTRYTHLQEGVNHVQLQIPAWLTCGHCVLQWKYTTADNWGCEQHGKNKEHCCFGCGNKQTTYYACADIAIYRNNHSRKNKKPGHVDTLEMTETSRKLNSTIVKRTKRQAMNRFNPGMIPVHSPGSGRSVQWSWMAAINGAGNQGNRMDAVGMRTGNLRAFPQGGFSMRTGGTANSGTQRGMVSIPEPVRSMVRVKQPIATPLFGRNSAGIPIRSALYQPGNGGQIFMTDTVTHAFNRHMMTKRPLIGNECKAVGPFRTRAMDGWCESHCMQSSCVVNECRCPGQFRSECNKCPFGLCLDDMLELQKLFPGLFGDPVTFLDCRNYEERLFSLKSFKILSEGLPECKHPRFKRQTRHSSVQFDDDDAGCCGTRPQVIMPLTVESDNDTFHVVQLPNDNNQFLVQGICGHNRTLTCPVCSPEHNFQWILVFDPRVRTSPAVNFVPVRFPHYCRCRNPGRMFG